MDLGKKVESPSEAIAPASPKKPKISYPSFSVNDEVFDEFKKQYPEAKVGDEITVTAKLKVSGHREDEFGKSVTFDVTHIEDKEGAKKDADGDEDGDKAEEKVLGYKRTKVKPMNEIPPASGKDLED